MTETTVENLFATAAKLPPGPERREFLLRHAGQEPELLRTLEELLKLHDDAGSFLELSALERDPSLVSQLSSGADPSGGLNEILAVLDHPFGNQPPDASDRTLGSIRHFQVVRPIGRGGSSIVLLAEDKHLGREVALKLLDPLFAAHPSARARFLREARSVASLRNDKVISIYEIGEQNQVPYLVMEYLPQGSLQGHLQEQGPLKLDEGLLVLQQVAEALQSAHERGVLHRDIKPSNVLIDQFPERVKLSDFGLATLPTDSAPEAVLGTPQYSSPEQLRGESVDPRSDLFSLGCLGYTVLTGRSPFAATSSVQTVLLTLQSTPEPLGRYGVQAPEALETLLRELTAKRPQDRPQTAREVVDRLREIRRSLTALTEGNAAGEPHSQSGKASRIWRRGFLLTGLGTLGWGGLRLLDRSQRQPSGLALSATEPSNFSLFDTRLEKYLHSAEGVVLIKSENPTLAHPNHYWRCEHPATLGTVVYRFPFERRLSGCLLHVQGYVTFGYDPQAWIRVSASADELNWFPLMSFKLERSELWRNPGRGFSTPMIPESSKNTMISQMPQQNLSAIMHNQSVLFLKAELFSVELLPDSEGGTLGPAAAQFLRCRPDNAKDPLKIIPQA